MRTCTTKVWVVALVACSAIGCDDAQRPALGIHPEVLPQSDLVAEYRGQAQATGLHEPLTALDSQDKSAGPSVEPKTPDDAAPSPPKATVNLKINRLVIARDIVRREPVGVATSFKLADLSQVCAFVELTNETLTPSKITVTFVPPRGPAMQPIQLDVGTQKRWRTWAITKKAKAAGTWSVMVHALDGAVLGTSTFTLTN